MTATAESSTAIESTPEQPYTSPSPWLTLPEAAAYSKYSYRHVRAACIEFQRYGDRGLKCSQPSREYRIHVTDLDRWIEGLAPSRTKRKSVW